MKKDMPQTRSNHNFLFYPILAIYILLAIWGVANHEQWRDEAQAWLIVRDLDLPELFKILRTEGHPPLWYLLIMPLAKSGLPYAAQSWLAAGIMIAAVYLLLFRTKLPLVVKIILPFTYFFLFEYLLFARSYCMIAFFTAAIMSLYPQRFERPWMYALCITGLFNTHVLIFTFCAMLVLMYWIEIRAQKLPGKPVRSAAMLMSVGGAYLLPYLFLAKMANEFDKGITDNAERMLRTITNGLTISQSTVLATILMVAAAIMMWKQTKALAILIGGLVSVLYILGYKYATAGYRHEGVVFFVFLAAVYIASLQKRDKKKSSIASLDMHPAMWVAALVCLLQLKPAIEYYRGDIMYVISDAKYAAAFLEENNLGSKILVGQQAWAASALLPFMDKDIKMYYGECERYGTYYYYDTCYINDRWAYPVEYSVNKAYSKFRNQLQDVVFIFNFPVSKEAEQHLELLYTTSAPPLRRDEAFFIYKFREGMK